MKKTHKEIKDWYNIREGRWEDLTIQQQIEYAFKLGFSWGVGTDLFDQKSIDKIFENDKIES